MTETAADQAREALRMAEGAPRRSIALARRVSGVAVRDGEFTAAAIAERAWGVACLHLGDLDAASDHLRSAVRFGRSAGSATLVGEARMSLAAVLSSRGAPLRGLQVIDAAAADLRGVQRARVHAQRGAILLQIGRYEDALASWREALPVLRAADDLVWIRRILVNRGIVRARRHEFPGAQSDLGEALRLTELLGRDLVGAFIEQNLGYVHSLNGDIPTSLAHLDRAERVLRSHGVGLGPLLTDRAELLLSARLLAEAQDTAERAVSELERERRRIVLPEARLLLATAARLDGDQRSAAAAAHRAAVEFGRQQRPQWAALARLNMLAATPTDQWPRWASGPAVERIVRTLSTAWPSAKLEGSLLAADLAARRGRADRAAAILADVSRGRRRGPAILRARAWYGEALLREHAANPTGTMRAARTGLRVLDEYGASLGATDLRAHAGGHRAELAGVGLRTALRGGRARQVLAWAEATRASHLMRRPVRPPRDRVLARALARLRTTALDIDEAQAEERPTGSLVAAQVALEREIRDHVRKHRGVAGPDRRPSPFAELSEALGAAALLEFVRADGRLHAVTVVDGRARLRHLADLSEVHDLTDRVPFALHRIVNREPGSPSHRAAQALLADAGRRLDALLLAPLPELVDRPLVVAPTGPLQSLPWSALPSCLGRPVTVCPSAELWLAALRPARRSAGRRVLVAAGSADLRGARAEAEAVSAIHGSRPLLDDAATVAAVAVGLDGAGLAHLATHGRGRTDNPLFSSLRFADGPLMVYDLERLRRPPHTVVLAACESGRPVVRTGDEVLGLGASLLGLGCAQLVASVVPIVDLQTTPMMVGLHRRLAAGEQVAVALAAEQEWAVGQGPVAAATAAGFVCFGAGFLPVPASCRCARSESAVGPARP